MKPLALVFFTLGSLTTFAFQSPCDPGQKGAFDFWLGTWQVFNGDQFAGTNTITALLDGCVVQESWNGVNNTGTSLNYFNPQTNQWQQHWVWANGTTITYRGGKKSKAMVMSAERIGQSGDPYIQRITWTPNDDGTVRQHSQGSKDGGKTWVTLYDLTYKKAKSLGQ